MGQDIFFILIWWLVFLLVGIVFLPLNMLIFSRFVDRGYIFSKILGMLLLGYTVFALGTFKILPFTHTAIIFILLVWGGISLFLLWKKRRELIEMLQKGWKLFLFEELIFLIALSFWSYIRAHEPSIHGLEKFMDFGFVNSVLRTDLFPAKDLWLTPFSINYYYSGHIVTAVLTKLSGIDPVITYNLMIATLFAFTFTGAFSIGANLVNQFKMQNEKVKITSQNLKVIIAGGLLAGFLVALAGNLHTIYAFFNAYDGENPVPFWTLGLDWNLTNYWYPNATRFIPLTIHEFPIYSFVVSDLHGHVLSIPIVLTIIAVLLSEFIRIKERMYPNIITLVLLSFLIATAYMTNAWDGLIYALPTGAVFAYLAYRSKNYPLYAIRYMLMLVGAILFTLPFSLHFKPFVSGIGVICAPEFLTKLGKLGPFIFEADHCQRSSLWQMVILHGFWYFWVISFLVFLYRHVILSPKGEGSHKGILPLRFAQGQNDILVSDIFVLILIALSTVLLVLPEFVYAKDIYPAHYRANTLFKLGYQAFMMLGISTAYVIVRMIMALSSRPSPPAGGRVEGSVSTTFGLQEIPRFARNDKVIKLGYWVIGIIGLFLVAIYPYFAINSYYGELKAYRGLDGLAYLRDLYPTDYEGILWLRDNIKGQPVILEGAGESYTDYARISANTGLPTVVGWPVHEWLWRGSYDEAGKRVAEVERIYTTANIVEAKRLLEMYNVEYVFVGALERQKYQALREETFKTLGMPIYQNGQTRIYRIEGI